MLVHGRFIVRSDALVLARQDGVQVEMKPSTSAILCFISTCRCKYLIQDRVSKTHSFGQLRIMDHTFPVGARH